MQEIPIEVVEQAWSDVFTSESVEDFQQVLNNMQGKQPYLLPFLYAGGENFFQEDEIGELLALGAVVWLAYEKASNGGMEVVLPQVLEELHDDSLDLLQKSDDSAIEDAAVQLATGSAQQPLLESVLAYLLEGENEIHPERQGIAFFLVKVVIDSLERSWRN